MDGFWCLTLAFVLQQATRSTRGTELIGAVGSSITFHLQSPAGEAAAWSFHGDVVVTVRFGDPPEATFFDDSFKPRLAFPGNGSALSISRLSLEDAGTYTAKSAGTKTAFTLRVYGVLEEPTVTCTGQNCSAGVCRYALLCAANGAGAGDVSYAWSMGSTWSAGAAVLVEESPVEEPLLTCTAQNPVSSRNITVGSAAALCAGTHSSRRAVIAAAAVVGSGALLASVILVLCCKPKGWRIFHLPADEAVNTEARAEYTTVYAQVGPFQQVYLQEGSMTTPTPGAETSKPTPPTAPATAQTDDEKMGKGLPGCWGQEEKTLYALVS
ncbi:T-lymphocyte surface antigen Ly-9 isoform X2 [Pezoporus flaviventris]|uniref:T-lymphocyte surface antigen Ly-9 isoform X2 n=1 Tax=Pezoporus flaviventris TaxID=889875 RepID=UPI002AAF6770|nr:T-lymphocyte surface antigen Ly-9 isoform X2 [Pezoporus flaviventris]